MKEVHRHWLPVLLLAALVRCGDSPTEPRFEPPDRNPTPTPADLDGTWSGHVSLWGDWIHDCPAEEDVTVELGHYESSVSGHLRTSCLGDLTLRGTLTGEALTLDVWTASEKKYTRITGLVKPTSIRAGNHSSNYGMSLTLKR
jgi:hypothetical protein